MLRSVGQRIESSLRAVDTVARIGDDAFAAAEAAGRAIDLEAAIVELERWLEEHGRDDV